MNLVALTDGTVTSTGSMTLQGQSTAGGKLGGVLITTDGTNAAVVTVQRNNASGKTLFSVSTKTPMMITAPIDSEGTSTLYYSVTGTGAAAQFYEWYA